MDTEWMILKKQFSHGLKHIYTDYQCVTALVLITFWV